MDTGAPDTIVSVESEDDNDGSTTEKVFPKFEERRMSELSVRAFIQRDRTESLSKLHKIINNELGEHSIDETHVEHLFKNLQFSENLFDLFDVRNEGLLDQSTWFGNLRTWAQVTNVTPPTFTQHYSTVVGFKRKMTSHTNYPTPPRIYQQLQSNYRKM